MRGVGRTWLRSGLIAVLLLSGLLSEACGKSGGDSPAGSGPDGSGAAGASALPSRGGSGGVGGNNSTAGGAGGNNSTGGGAGGAQTSNGGAAGGAPSLPTLPADQALFASQVSQAFCASNVPCCTHGVANCMATTELQISTFLANAASAKNSFDAASAAKCLTAVKDLGPNPSCSRSAIFDHPALLEACSAVLDGTVDPGNPCQTAEECRRHQASGTLEANAAECAAFGASSERRCRLFTRVGAVGAGCFDQSKPVAASEASVVDLCDPSLECVSEHCQALPKPGDPCSGAGEPCQNGFCSMLFCAAFAKEGANCQGKVCEVGFGCGSANLCERLPKEAWSLRVGFNATAFECPQ